MNATPPADALKTSNDPGSTSYVERIARPTTLWDSYTGETADMICVLFNRAADLLQAKGYDRYGITEDPDAAGQTIFEALACVIREYVTTAARSAGMPGPTIEHDITAMREELELRLAGVLYVTGAFRSERPFNGMTEMLWSWTRDVVRWENGHALYRGKDDAIRLLRLAAVMTITVDIL